MCSSGDQDLKNTEDAQAAFTKQLQSSFQTQFAGQSGILQQLTNTLTPMITNPQGFTAGQKTTLQTQNAEGAAKDYAAAQTATNNAVAARGGSALPSGVGAQLSAENANAGAAEKATGDQNIELADAQQAQQNKQFAINALSGVASQYNPTGYASDANSGASTTADIGQAYKASTSSQLLGVLGGIAGGAGSALGGYLGKK